MAEAHDERVEKLEHSKAASRAQANVEKQARDVEVRTESIGEAVEEAMEQQAEALRALAHNLRILPPHGTLGDVWRADILRAGDVLALDYDQTITTSVGTSNDPRDRLRGGDDTRKALEEMSAAGVILIIMTAQSPLSLIHI